MQTNVHLWQVVDNKKTTQLKSTNLIFNFSKFFKQCPWKCISKIWCHYPENQILWLFHSQKCLFVYLDFQKLSKTIQSDYSLSEKESVGIFACNIHYIVTDKSMGVWGYGPSGDFLQLQPSTNPSV